MIRHKKSDDELLKVMAEYRLLDLAQITALHFSGRQVAARRMSQLVEAGLAQGITKVQGRKRGRPERLFTLGPGGIERLREIGVLPRTIPLERITGESLVHVQEHHLLVNWFRIHLGQIEKDYPNLETRFLTMTSPFFPSQAIPCLRVEIPTPGFENGSILFTPDGIFTVTDRDQEKTVLFYLEVDMGTETLVSSQGGTKDIRQKVINYQSCFRSEIYKRCEQIWRHRLNGFRLLFLTHNATRMAEICRLAQAMKPSNFIWITERERMFEEGLAGAIWARGGHIDQPRQSILGKNIYRRSPVLPDGL